MSVDSKHMRMVVAVVCSWSVGCATKPSFQEAHATKDCPFTLDPSQVLGQTVRCGYVLTPEVHAKPLKNIAVPVLVFKGVNAQAAPVVNLAGGPGQSWADLGLDTLPASASTKFAEDVIFFEQRGTGLSKPTLDCPAQGHNEDDLSFIARCAASLQAKGIDPSAYNTEELAGDVDTMRAVLGYDKILVSGVSYGTAWALETLRLYAKNLSGVVLDSVVSPTTPPLLDGTKGEIDALRALFAECNGDAACHETFGDIEATMRETLATLAQTPLMLQGGKLTLDGKAFLALVIATLESDPGLVPLLVQSVHDGAYDPSTETAPSRDASDNHFAFGQYMSVTCSDNQYVTADAINASIAEIADAYRPYVSASELSLVEYCTKWPFRHRDAQTFAPVTSDVPTLILSGNVDAVTPSEWAREVASTLPHATLVQVPGVGHDVASWGVSCVAHIESSFYHAPAQATDTTCLASVHTKFATSVSAARGLPSLSLPPSALANRVPRWAR